GTPWRARRPRRASPPCPCGERLSLAVSAIPVPLPRRGDMPVAGTPRTAQTGDRRRDAYSMTNMRAERMVHIDRRPRHPGVMSAQDRTVRGGGRFLAMLACLLAALACLPAVAVAEDGYELWLRYRPVDAARAGDYRARFTQLVAPTATATQRATRDELLRGLGGLLGHAPAQGQGLGRAGALLVGTPGSLPHIARLQLALDGLGDEGYLIRSTEIDGRAATVVAANSDTGALYGAFHLLRLLQTGQAVDALDLREAPKVKLRVLNHWDDLNRHVERGYSGQSIWDWHRLPGWLDPRYTDYARANASIGINGTVLNNVNANAQILTPMYLDKVAALAGVMRAYGIRVYLSARFSAPMEIGGLGTADPKDPAVQRWWRAKTEEIYAKIPDFGGFLVKANSEGQPGPQDFGRSHADGANMLADAVAPHGGVVMWRAFVYSDEEPDDRHKQAYTEFVPHDGEF